MKRNNTLRSVVVLLDPRGTILGGGPDVIERIQRYGVELQRLNKKVKLLVFSSHTKSEDFLSSSLDIIWLSKPTFNAAKFALKAHKYLRKNQLDYKILIAGDPWESFWSAFILNKLKSKKTPVQIQLHGDIADSVWKKISLKNRIRFNFAKLSINKAESLRLVSNKQSINIISAFKIKQNRIIVIPVPINKLKLPLDIDTRKPISLGFIGRIHNDRGIHNFIKLIKSLTVVRDDITVVIAGSGPDESRFLEEIKDLLPKSKVRFLGQLSENELRGVWKKIGVLVSSAPAESYGRVMREALVAGVPVWATKSSGVEDLISKAGKEAVKLLDLTKGSHELSMEFDQLLKAKVPLSFRKQFIKDNSTYARLLARSWVDLINKQKQ
jgi:glycosyltransferase involved in cell wall biosynthesis